MIYIVVTSSILLQLVATIITIRLTYVTKKGSYWAMLALAMVVQVVRRLYSLFEITTGTRVNSNMMISELIALVVSILMTFAVVGIAQIFKRMKLDINDRENVISEKEKNSQLILDTVGVIVMVIDKYGTITMINKMGCHILGYNESEIVGKNWFRTFLPDEKKGIIEKLFYEYINRNNPTNVQTENSIIGKDGIKRLILWDNSLLKDQNGNATAILATGKDITLKREMEAKNIELQKSMQMEAIKSEFFANISHEFRTPLNIILSIIQIAEKNMKKIEPTKESTVTDYGKYFKTIKQNTYRLLKLVNNLVDLTKIDLGYFDLQMQNCNIINIVEEITLSTVQYIEAQGITLEFDTDMEERVLACDPDKIERILLNLLSNAVKFTDPGGNIWVNLSNFEDRILISVKDNGIGIEKDKINIIFEKFMQVDKSLTRRNEGSGIGLSIVKLIIEMHGGNIYVNSELGKGSEFLIELPVVLCKDGIVSEPETKVMNSQVQRINIEFSDIYSLN